MAATIRRRISYAILPATIRSLLRPGAYDHPSDDVRLIQTHISWILLSGEFAYKIKKPVRFGFLDYSDLAQRKEMCDQEVLLNRRTCPDAYLGVDTGRRAGRHRAISTGEDERSNTP